VRDVTVCAVTPKVDAIERRASRTLEERYRRVFEQRRHALVATTDVAAGHGVPPWAVRKLHRRLVPAFAQEHRPPQRNRDGDRLTRVGASEADGVVRA